MKNRSNTLKAARSNKAWFAAGVVAAGLFSVSAIGSTTVSAATLAQASAANTLAAPNQTGKVQADLDAYAKGMQIGRTGAISLPAHFTNGQRADYIEAITAGFKAGQLMHQHKLNHIDTIAETPNKSTQASDDAAAKANNDVNNQNPTDPTGKVSEDLDAYAKGMQIGKTGAASLPAHFTDGQRADYIEAITAGFKAGQLMHQSKLNHIDTIAETPNMSTQASDDAAAKANNDVNNQNPTNPTGKTEEDLDAYNRGLQIGKTGAASLPAHFTDGKSADYIEAIKAGFKAGQLMHQSKLNHIDTIAETPNKSTEASNAMEPAVNSNLNKMENLPNLSTLASEKARSEAEKNGEDGAEEPDFPAALIMPAADITTPRPTPAPKPGQQSRQPGKKTASQRVLPHTGEASNVAAAGLGVFATLGALLGLSGIGRKRA
ncbi:LPXTG cell wall anchor domain-containing protein [Lacticaseibacillus sp. 53-4]|uniref:LPXTG cell wall anchor domain-containing protein n=1 Tax=Lacticaseibacillus sp. 53-4 TaxID=2799575 RepID=UPI0019424A73|nr:LPXTG cell wall anchor domain-containing protein [Lacticaseibacillus sp. 53-4]